ncbi:DUF924 family protein [Roseibium sediminis]|uniref:DUF924 family protein n=1 Tax=Roseibium sediminis TaxID=1775174 RepID=UPI00123E3C10|nr:DUF924 family protein [Roseibium sediminis]
MAHSLSSAVDVLEFWWDAGPSKWFAKNDKFDHECKTRFVHLIEAGQEGELDHWAETPVGMLALIIVLDQFSRNVFRASPRAFESDAKALELARQAVAKGYDKAFPKDVRSFFYLPFEHAEDMDAQETSVDLFRVLGNQEAYLYALIHMDVIRRFGRFPHRNKVLGRESTQAERDYMENGGFSA